LINTGKFFRKTVRMFENLDGWCTTRQPIYLKQVAKIIDVPESTTKKLCEFRALERKCKKRTNINRKLSCSYYFRCQNEKAPMRWKFRLFIDKVVILRTTLIPDLHVTVEISRNYGETASQKYLNLVWHLIGTIFAVTLVVCWQWVARWIGRVLSVSNYLFIDLVTLLYDGTYTLKTELHCSLLVFVTGNCGWWFYLYAENYANRHFKIETLASLKQAGLYMRLMK